MDLKKRICDYCKKPMFSSLSGVWVGKKFIEVHAKCKEDWKHQQIIKKYKKINNFSNEEVNEIKSIFENK